jgi:hypothetical protein
LVRSRELLMEETAPACNRVKGPNAWGKGSHRIAYEVIHFGWSSTMAGNESNIRVRFREQEFSLSICLYEGAPHFTLRLDDPRDARLGHWASAVFAPEAKLQANQVLVLDIGKTRGILKALEDAGVVRASGELRTWCGVRLPVAELLIEPPAHLKEAIQTPGGRHQWVDGTPEEPSKSGKEDEKQPGIER